MEQSPAKPTITFDFRSITTTIRRSSKDYFMGMLLQPWIWAMGYILLSGIFIIITITQNTEAVLSQSNVLPGSLTVLHVWIISMMTILINYTYAYVTRFKTPRLNPIMFLISLNVLLVLLLSLTPYFTSFLFD